MLKHVISHALYQLLDVKTYILYVMLYLIMSFKFNKFILILNKQLFKKKLQWQDTLCVNLNNFDSISVVYHLGGSIKNALVLVQVTSFQQVIGLYTLQCQSEFTKVSHGSRS